MKSKFLMAFLLMLHGISYADQGGEVSVNILSYGARPNDGKDDYQAFSKLFAQITASGRSYKVFIPKGQYEISKRINCKIDGQTVTLQGENGTKIVSQAQLFLYMTANFLPIAITNSIKRNDDKIVLSRNDIQKIRKGDVLHIQSSSVFETGWKYKENDIHRIKSTQGNQVQLESGSLFNYDPSKERVTAKVYKQSSFNVSNIQFVLTPVNDKARAESMNVIGMKLKMDKVSFKYTGNNKYFHNAMTVAACENVSFSNMYFDNLQYGVTLNFCRNINAYKTEARYVRHCYAPATATANVYVEDLKGYYCHSVMDAHVAFNVHFKNVFDTLVTKFPGCRALGTFIENARIYPLKNGYYQLYTYWSVQTLVKEYEHLYKEVDTRFKNVEWVTSTGGRLNGLTSYTCRNLIVEGCKTHSVGYYGAVNKMDQVNIKNSEIGMIYIDGQKTVVSNTTMNGKLAPQAPFVFRFASKGETRLENIVVKNYNKDSVYLFNRFYDHFQQNKTIIENLKSCPLKGWTDKLMYGLKKNPGLIIKDSRFDSFSEALPATLTDIKKYVRLRRL